MGDAQFRPRQSILALFDPLTSPAKPGISPSIDANKENLAPPLAELLGIQPNHSSSNLPRNRRLIDIGDVTIGEATVEEESKTPSHPRTPSIEDATPRPPSFSSPSHKVSPASPRMPLAEITPDLDTTMVIKPKAIFAAGPSATLRHTSTADSAAEAKVDGKILISSHTNSEEKIPEITISPPNSSSTSSSPSNEPATTSLPSGNQSIPHTSSSCHSSSVSSSLVAPQALENRQSVDLGYSFHLHLRNDEASFNLLKDEISFFSANDPQLDEDSFSMDLKAIKKHFHDVSRPGKMASKSPPRTGPSVEAKIALTPSPQQPSLRQQSNRVGESCPKESDAEATSRNKNGVPSNSPTTRIPLAGHGSGQRRKSLVALVTESNPRTPQLSARPIALPPPVPALRIVKRSKKLVHDSESTGSSESSSAERKSTLPTQTNSSKPKPSVTRAHVSRTTPLPHASAAMAPTRPLTISAKCEKDLGTGPRRVLISETTIAQPKVGNSVRAGQAPNASSGPRRVLITTNETVSAGSRPTHRSGIKPPAQIAGRQTTGIPAYRPRHDVPASRASAGIRTSTNQASRSDGKLTGSRSLKEPTTRRVLHASS